MGCIEKRLLNCNIHYQHWSFSAFVQEQAQMKQQEVDLYATVPHLMIDHLRLGDISMCTELLQQTGLHIPVFSPRAYGYSLFLDSKSDIGKASVDYYCNCVHAAADIGAELLCIQPANGVFFYSKDRLLENGATALRKIALVAADKGVRIALGTNNPQDTPFLRTKKELDAVLDAAGCSNMGLLIDTHIISQAEETLSMWLAPSRHQVYHVRLADGRAGGYRSWGEGVYPLSRFIDALEDFDGRITLFLAGCQNTGDPAQADRQNRELVIAAEEHNGV